jgi:hypothetical protein
MHYSSHFSFPLMFLEWMNLPTTQWPWWKGLKQRYWGFSSWLHAKLSLKIESKSLRVKLQTCLVDNTKAFIFPSKWINLPPLVEFDESWQSVKPVENVNLVHSINQSEPMDMDWNLHLLLWNIFVLCKLQNRLWILVFKFLLVVSAKYQAYTGFDDQYVGWL